MPVVSLRARSCRAPGLVVLLAAGTAAAMPVRGTGNLRTITAAPSPGGGALPAPDLHIGQDIQYINQCYDQIGLSFVHASDVQIIGQATYTVNDLISAGGLFTQVREAGVINMYYVNSFTYTATAATYTQELVANQPPGQQVSGIVANPYTNNFTTGRMIDTMSHEVGHMLLDTWRWRNAEGSGNQYGMVHSRFNQDIMSPSNTPRLIPGNLNQVWPGGNTDQIRRNVGYYDINSLPAFQGKKTPLIYAMLTNNNQGLITINSADQVKVGIDNGGGLIDTGMYAWNAPRTPGQGPQYLDIGSRHVQVYESARRQPGNQERLSFHFYADTAWGSDTPTFKIFDIDSVESSSQYTSYITGSSIVEVSPDFTTDTKVMDGPGIALIPQLVLGTDYAVISSFDFALGKLTEYNLQITRAGALNGMNDIVISLNMQVPAPGAPVILGLSGLLGTRRRRPRMRI